MQNLNGIRLLKHRKHRIEVSKTQKGNHTSVTKLYYD